jgi:large subunit ribosomal protein L2
MGKKIKVQRRGRGTSLFRAQKMGRISPVKYPPNIKKNQSGVLKKLYHEPGRGAPIAYIELYPGKGYYTTAIEGTYINQNIMLGPEVPVQVGNVLPLKNIPEGTMVSNLEIRPGDGGRIAKSSGSYGTVVSHTNSKTTIKLPSKKSIQVSNEARATIGIISGSGRKEKPFMKAGEAHHAKRAKGHIYPVAHGVKMSAAMHPHGGGRHRRPGKSTTVSRHAPPGAKVGLIAARNSGKRQRRRN